MPILASFMVPHPPLIVPAVGRGGERQIAGDPKVAVATSGGGPMAAALLLAKD